MSNLYITQPQFLMLLDRRTGLQLSGDANLSAGTPTNLDFILDMSASIVDSVLYGRYDITFPQGVPKFCTWLVYCKATSLLFARRNDKPKQVDEDEKKADDWIEMIIEGKISIPGYDRAQQPNLIFSDSLTGKSVWDNIYDLPISPTSPAGSLNDNV